MAVTYVGAGTRLGTASGRSVAYPASTTAGNLLLLVIANKDGSDTASTPSGWTAPSNNTTSGGAGTDGTTDEGTCRVSVFHKVADGTEGGTNLTITVSGTNKALTARIYQFSKDAGSWSVACGIGSKDSGGSTAYSITTASDPGIAAGDIVQACTAINSDAYLYSAASFTTSGVTYGANTELDDVSNPNSANLRYLVNQSPVSSGASSGNTTFAATATGSATNAPAGPTVVVRIREEAGGLSITSVTPSSFDDGRTGIVIAGSGFGASQGSSTLTIGGQAQTVTAWSDTSITFTSVRGSNSMGARSLTLTRA